MCSWEERSAVSIYTKFLEYIFQKGRVLMLSRICWSQNFTYTSTLIHLLAHFTSSAVATSFSSRLMLWSNYSVLLPRERKKAKRVV